MKVNGLDCRFGKKPNKMIRVIVVFSILCCAARQAKSAYTAAVYEHVHRDPLGILGTKGVKNNLAAFEEAATIASQNEADIIVFPEYGIISPRGSRETIASFLEYVPDPKDSLWNPCLQKEIFEDRPILTRLSCMARINNISVVANMGAKEQCLSTGCRLDGQYQLNTNVVFDRNGTLLARYYKRYLYLEGSFDVHPESKIVTFNTDIGRFGTFTCFDIIFRPAVEMVDDHNIDSVAFPTWWFDSHPWLSSIQLQEAWAIRHNITLLAANIHSPILGSTGSGIYTGKGATVYTHAADSKSKILITKVNDPHSARIITQNVSGQLLPSQYNYKHFNLENYTLFEVAHSSGELSACNRGLCCNLTYQLTAELSEKYYLAVVNAIRTGSKRYFWCEEGCLLIRCKDRATKRCTRFPAKSTTVFSQFRLSGNFTSKYVYPNVLLSEMKLLSTSFWSYEVSNDSVVLKSEKPINVPILSVSLYGRCYDRDPPYRP